MTYRLKMWENPSPQAGRRQFKAFKSDRLEGLSSVAQGNAKRVMANQVGPREHKPDDVQAAHSPSWEMGTFPAASIKARRPDCPAPKAGYSGMASSHPWW